MADVRPILATHYDLDVVGSLQDVAAPPYDVIDTEMRAELLGRSPYNAVAIDLPKPYGETGPQQTDDDPYERAARTMQEWREAGVLVTDAKPTIWAMTQDYTGPDGTARTRNAILARVRVEDFSAGQVLPHERTLPGPKQDRLDLMRATRHNLSPIFALTTEDAWPLISTATELAPPWGETTDEDGTVTRIWPVENEAVQALVKGFLGEAKVLIADGHHRYETAIAYRDEVGGKFHEEGDHDFTLMALTGLDDPGLTVFPTHRLLSGLREDSGRQARLGNGLRERFDVEEVPIERLDPFGEEGIGVFGLYDSFHGKAFRLRLKDAALAELEERLPIKPRAYHHLDAAILERLVLMDLAGLSEDDILAKRGLGYAKSVEDSLALIEAGTYDVAFLMRPIPIDQVRAICESNANMPPKSTYFFPKVPTGLVFNPVG